MGIFFNSLKRQFGRDTGKVISNTIYGNSHATPYREVNKDKIELENKKIAMQKSNGERQDLYLLDAAVIGAVDQIILLDIGGDEKEIVKASLSLEMQLAVNKWMSHHKGKIAAIRNKYPDAVLKKYEQCIEELEFLKANDDRIFKMKKVAAKYKKIGLIQQYGFFAIPALLVIVLLIVITFS
ncbi:MAG: hypothetical protein EOO44_21845 [Flavobacterium sp.]|nr:MAG: hypothetical protein EOO44_21845 [Flavobacterium sp.]